MARNPSDVRIDKAIAKKDGSTVKGSQFRGGTDSNRPGVGGKIGNLSVKGKAGAPDGRSPKPQMTGSDSGSSAIFKGPADSVKRAPHITVATSTSKLKAPI